MPAEDLAVIAAGIFFLNGLLTGVWKYRQISASESAQAHPYVDIAHRSSLLYSFAAMLLAQFARISQLPNSVELVAMALLLGYFALAILGYMLQGYRRQTDNQFRHATPGLAWLMWSLVVAEIGGFLVLFYGVLVQLL
jgi:hypothetical protein